MATRTITYNNEKGFSIETENEEQYYAKPKHLQGTCIMENCIRIGEFWRKGWTETMMCLSLIKNPDRLITHANIFNKKTNKIIDVANGKIKMVDYGQWSYNNNIIALSVITYDDALKFKRTDGIEYNGTTDKEMMGLRVKCNSVFMEFMKLNKD